jgi:hypothetical protein
MYTWIIDLVFTKSFHLEDKMLSSRQVGYLLGHEHHTIIEMAEKGELPYSLNVRGWKEFDEQSVMDHILKTYRTPHTDNWEAWFSGFVDGEGHFAIQHLSNKTYVAHFEISQRIEDELLIRSIQEHLGFGHIYLSPKVYFNKHGEKIAKKASFYVHDLNGCIRLSDILRAYPLRTLKRQDLEIWNQFIELKRHHVRAHDVEEFRRQADILFHQIQQVRRDRKIQ